MHYLSCRVRVWLTGLHRRVIKPHHWANVHLDQYLFFTMPTSTPKKRSLSPKKTQPVDKSTKKKVVPPTTGGDIRNFVSVIPTGLSDMVIDEGEM
jgi:hypothetical protein